MDYSHASILLLLLSLALLVTEVFVPSGGFVAVLMLLSLAGSVFCAFQAWWETSPGLWWSYVGSVLFLLPAVLIAAFVIFPKTPYGRRILLDAPDPDEITPYAREQLELQALVGKRGKTASLHSPAGLIEVDGRRFHSETRGMMLDPGETVEIVGVKGNRLVIRLADRASESSDSIEALASDAEDVSTASHSDETTRGEADAAPPVDPFDPFVDESRPE